MIIKHNRLLNNIHETAQKFGAKGVWGSDVTETGVCRLALSDEDKGVRDWFVGEVTKLGCTVKVDQIGNIFATYPGKTNGPPIAIGSHLDTQPTGGRYDGILGVLSGLEVIQTLKDNEYTPHNPICVISWTNEEGARFPMSMMASSVWAGNVELPKAYSLKSVLEPLDVTVKKELQRIGYLGAVPASYKENPLAAHFELHIEQGPILENLNKKIGVLSGVQALRWIKVTVGGRAQHTGTTPFNLRKDPLLAASKMMVVANEIAQSKGGLASVGILNLEPGSVNVIPEKVTFTLDIRHNLDDKLADIERECKQKFAKIAEEGNGTSTKESLTIEFENLYDSPAVHFNENTIASVRQAAVETVGESNLMDIVSGAGHDSCNTSRVVPTSMIFVPSKDGISHNPTEYTKPDEIADGCQVLLGAVLNYDKFLQSSSKNT
ncbi:putative beta alanine synthase [Sugiyamaella lignohabitans]|uniref:Putative beta alanine synthase n=1 Tax=Sugiyamaella lignohabitans TaxID=796027 RepID=A0A167G0A7_9ASCO|nr:putative beta alanine synthase [Sugiyamaella lignohabitans]ANB15933.1 putative beta alanine synthase [Sugiyamaella lignohabitans]